MFCSGDKVQFSDWFGKITHVHSMNLVTVLWEDGNEQLIHTDQLKKVKEANRFNFIIFKNYDGTKTGKSIPREAWRRIMKSTANN